MHSASSGPVSLGSLNWEDYVAYRKRGGPVWNTIRGGYVGRPKPYWTMALTAYLDDSREYWHGYGFHAIAGYLAPTDFWDFHFAPHWKQFLKSGGPVPVSEFKSSHLSGVLSGEFEDWSREDANKFIIGAVDEIVRYPESMYGVGALVTREKFSNPGLAKLFEETSIRLCVNLVVGTIGMIVEAYGQKGPIHVFCDEQNEYEPILKRDWKEAAATFQSRYGVEISDLDFKDSKKVLPIQAADLLVYETRRDLKTRIERPNKPRSMALERLLRAHLHTAVFVDASSLLADEDDARATGRKYAGEGTSILYNSSPFWFGHTEDEATPDLFDPRPLRSLPLP